MIVVTVGGLVKYKNKFIFVKTNKWKGKWGIPGGKVKYGETLLQALIREIKEELNLDIKPQNCKYITFFEAINDEEFYKPTHMLLFNYLVKIKDISSLKTNEEIIELSILDKNEINKIQLNKYTKLLLEKI